jgi:hypothetical protein
VERNGDIVVIGSVIARRDPRRLGEIVVNVVHGRDPVHGAAPIASDSQQAARLAELNPPGQ